MITLNDKQISLSQWVSEDMLNRLHNAIADNDPLAVEKLVSAGADVNGIMDGQTSLHVAARFGAEGCIEVLLASGADPYIEDDSFLQPEEIAYRMGHDNCVNIFREKERAKRLRPK